MLVLHNGDNEPESLTSGAEFPHHFAQGPRLTVIEGITQRWKFSVSTVITAENRAIVTRDAPAIITADPAQWFEPDSRFTVSLEPERILGVRYRYPWQLWRSSGETDEDFETKRLSIERVLKNDKGWSRAGIEPFYEPDAEKALCIVRIVAETPVLYCEHERDSGGILDLPLALVEQGKVWMWAVNHGFGHAMFAMRDMKTIGRAYSGCMGGFIEDSIAGYVPSDAEIESARLWLRGMSPIVVE